MKIKPLYLIHKGIQYEITYDNGKTERVGKGRK